MDTDAEPFNHESTQDTEKFRRENEQRFESNLTLTLSTRRGDL
jgi:hypothetical protein